MIVLVLKQTSDCASSIKGLFYSKGYGRAENSLKPYPDLFVKTKLPKTISGPIRSFTVKENHISSVVSEILGPIRSFTVKENHIGSVVSEILHYRQKQDYYFILQDIFV